VPSGTRDRRLEAHRPNPNVPTRGEHHLTLP
jgi:hypothetical protein